MLNRSTGYRKTAADFLVATLAVVVLATGLSGGLLPVAAQSEDRGEDDQGTVPAVELYEAPTADGTTISVRADSELSADGIAKSPDGDPSVGLEAVVSVRPIARGEDAANDNEARARIQDIEPDPSGSRPIEMVKLDPELVSDLSPFGVGVELRPDDDGSMASQSIEVDFDPADIVFGGDATGRLQLVRYDGCETNPQGKLTCATVEVLPTTVDAKNGVARAVVDGDPAGASTSTAAGVPGVSSEAVIVSASVVTLSTGGRSLSGDYSATAIESLSSYEVALSTGSAEATYEVPMPPAAAGPEPQVAFTYSSGSIDGLNAGRNTQSGPIGLGWTMMAGGSISREIETCNLDGVAKEDKCLLGDGADVTKESFSITLNGVASKLVQVSGEEYRLQNDPMWKVFRRFDGTHGHARNESWEVITPDGMRWLFGTDTNSARSVPVYHGRTAVEAPCVDADKLCDTVYQWDVDRATDTSGNVMEFSYLQETNHYNARGQGTNRKYVRYSSLAEITYGAFQPSDETKKKSPPNARVKLNWEQRCKGWGLVSDCQFPNDFLDAPADRWCPTEASPCSDKVAPTFWSQLRLGSVQTQIRQGDGAWLTDTAHDLIQFFPEAVPDDDGDANQQKMTLVEIVQRPNGVGDDAWRHYGLSPVLAANYDAIKAAAAETIETAGDIGFDSGVDLLGGGDQLSFNGVWFGGMDDDYSIATQFSIRYASRSSGAVEVWVDGKPEGQVDLPSTGSMTTFSTVSTDIELDSGVGDVELRFKGGPRSDRVTWFQFSLPEDDVDQLPGLPPVSYADTTEPNNEAWEWLPNRVNAPAGVPDMKLPRVKTIENELGGIVEFDYGQSEDQECPKNTVINFYVQTFDCYGGFFGGDDSNVGDVVLWNKWKVIGTTVTPGADQPPMETTYKYVGEPQWAHTKIGTSCEGFFNDWRGHNIVEVTDAAGVTEYRFFNGMDDAGSTCESAPGRLDRSVTLSDGSETFVDDRILHGQQYEMIRKELDGTPVEREVTLFDDDRGAFAGADEKGIFVTAGSGKEAARFITPWRIETSALSGTDKTSVVDYIYDLHGNIVTEYQRGDKASADDDRRVETKFVKNLDAWIVSTPCRERVLSGTANGEVFNETRWGYDADRSQDPDKACEAVPGRGLVTSEWAYSTETATSQATSNYNDRGQMILATDPNGNQTKFGLDPRQGWLRAETNPLGWETKFDYDELGRQTSISDINTNVTKLTYDDFDRLSTVVLPANTSSDPSYEFQYDMEARPVQVTTKQLFDETRLGDDQFLASVSYIDGLGRDIQMQARAQAVGRRWISAASFDAAGRLLRQSTAFEASGEVLESDYFSPNWSSVPLHHEFSYDARGETTRDRTIGTAPGEDNTDWDMDFVYDGWTTQAYDETADRGVRTDYEYDAFGNLAKVKEYDGAGPNAPVYATTAHEYDAAERLVSSTDANDNITRLTYDRQGRRTGVDDPNIGQWAFIYDANGNLTLQRDARDVWLRFDYDPIDRLTTRRESDAESGAGPMLAEFTYDHESIGRDRLYRTRSHTPDGQLDVYNQNYNDEGLLTDQQTIVPGDFGGKFKQLFTYGPGAQQLTNQYPANNNYGTGEVVTTTFDHRTGLPIGLSSTVEGTIVDSTIYGPDGQRRSRTFGDAGREAVEVWDVDQRTERTMVYQAGVGGSSSNVVAMEYDYDTRGNTSSIVDGRNANQNLCFGYDNFSRLVQGFTGDDGCAQHDPSRGEDPFDETYTYDEIHNIASKTGLGTYTYGTGDAGPLAVTSTESGRRYSYDQNGNQTQRTIDGNTQLLTFDSDNRLASVETAGEPAQGLSVVIAVAEATKTISGMVRSDDGPVGGVTLDLYTAAGPNKRDEFVTDTISDARGEFEFTKLDDCHIVVAIAPDGSVFVNGTGFSEHFLCVNDTAEPEPPSQQRSSGLDPPSADQPSTVAALSAGGDTVVERYLYDADGERIARIQGTDAVVYIGESFEWRSTGQSRSQVSHYYLGGRRVGVNEGGDFKYAFNDHLNSASGLASTIDDIEVGRYTPWGETRGEEISGHLSYGGQRLSTVTDLLDYGARFYDPVIGRFVSADNGVPDFNNPLALNRYAYAMNNPLTYLDPTGEWGLSSVKNAVKSAGGAVAKATKKTVEVAKKVDVHTALDVAGMIPVVGEFADAANAGLYLLEGDYANAALSAASMIPIAGNAATAARLCKKLCDEVAQGVAKGAREVAERGVKRKARSRAGRALSECAVGNSFVPGTGVLLADGTSMPIEQVEVGEMILAHDPLIGTTEPRGVTAAIVGYGTKSLVDIEFDGALTTATDRHPYWDVEAGHWIDARDLTIGTTLLSSDLEPVVVASVQIREVDRQTVHNLTIDGLHTFFVGEADEHALVHNCGGRSVRTRVADSVSNVRNRLTGRQTNEGIYQFLDQRAGKFYVGQSGNIQKRLKKHISDGRLSSLSDARTWRVTGSRTTREVAEQLRITRLGGIRNLANNRNPIGIARQHLLPRRGRLRSVFGSF